MAFYWSNYFNMGTLHVRAKFRLFSYCTPLIYHFITGRINHWLYTIFVHHWYQYQYVGTNVHHWLYTIFVHHWYQYQYVGTNVHHFIP